SRRRGSDHAAHAGGDPRQGGRARRRPGAPPGGPRALAAMARGLWKGAISFGLVNVPVELFSAQKRSAEIDLTMLDKRDMAPVGYKRVNKSTGKEEPWENDVRGYKYEEEKYVVQSVRDRTRGHR